VGKGAKRRAHAFIDFFDEHIPQLINKKDAWARGAARRFAHPTAFP
jgi:hypothetical protein